MAHQLPTSSTRYGDLGRELDTGSFPGSRVTGVCLILAPLLLLASAILSLGIYHAKGADYVAAMAEHQTRTSIAFDGIVAGMALMLLAVIGLAQLITRQRPTLGRWAGVVTTLGLLGPFFFNGVYFAGYQLTDADTQAIAGKMMDSAQIMPSNVINLSGPALVIGFILLAIGAAKAEVLSRNRAIALGLAAIMPVGFISGYIAISGVAFAFAAIATVPLGLKMLRLAGEESDPQVVESAAHQHP